jgi:hypothetical protein
MRHLGAHRTTRQRIDPRSPDVEELIIFHRHGHATRIATIEWANTGEGLNHRSTLLESSILKIICQFDYLDCTGIIGSKKEPIIDDD